MFRNSVVLFIALLVFGCTTSQSQTDKTSFTAKEFSEKISETKNPQIIDVRTPEEYETGHITNAHNFNWNDDDFLKNVADLDKTKPVFVYCLSGGRSSDAAAALRKEGFNTVFEMPGGMMEWRAKNMPLASASTVSTGMNRQQYEELLQTDKTVLIDFYAEWCIPCKKMKPYLDKITKEMEETVSIIRIDADKNPELCKELHVENLPTLKLYKNNKLIWEHVGFVEEEALRLKLK